jgi:ferredoxin-NADP reductase
MEESMKLTLKEKHPEIAGVKTFIFEPEQPISWQPGQYMHYVLDHSDPDDRGTERWFTIASAPFEKHIQITTRFDGERESSFKRALDAMNPGDTIEADGPKGKFTLQEGEHPNIFIAGGIGITPYRSMLAQLAHDNKTSRIDLLYANRDSNFVFGEELKGIQSENPGFQILEFIDKHIEEPDLQGYLGDKSAIFYISGPEPMVEAYEELFDKLGVEKDRVKTDYFPGYQQA